MGLVVAKEEETKSRAATIEAEKDAKVSAIRMQQQIQEREAQKRMAEIEDEQMLHREKAKSDALFYEKARKAEANKALYTDEFVALELAKSVAQNSKIYFGPSVNSMLVDFIENMKTSITKK